VELARRNLEAALLLLKALMGQGLSQAVLCPGSRSGALALALGVLEPRFGWGELPEQGVVVVSGPPAYVRLIEATLAALPSAPGGQQVRVFRLKHAAVEDRIINYRDREITTPGVANILRNLVLGSTSASGQRTVAMPNLSAVSNSSLETGATAAGAAATPASSAGGAASPRSSAAASGPLGARSSTNTKSRSQVLGAPPSLGRSLMK
jgi:type III secretion protein C